MSGNATFSGTHFQGRVAAFIYAHVLAQSRLGWFETTDDTPLSVSGETQGPGDDIRVELAGTSFEVQAKHGMTAGTKLVELVKSIDATASKEKVVLAVNRASSKKLYTDIASDLDRIRAGRMDALTAATKELIADLGTAVRALERLVIISIDVDDPRDAEWKTMAAMLANVVVAPEKIVSTQSILADDGSRLCAKRLRRTKKDLSGLLEAAQIQIKPPHQHERLERELDHTLRLIRDAQASAALTLLEEHEHRLDSNTPVALRYRLLQQKGGALLQLGRTKDALAAALRAKDLDSSRPEALRVAAIAHQLEGRLKEAREAISLALKNDPEDVRSWSISASISNACGEPLVAPPPSVAASRHYRLQAAEILGTNGDWQGALEITRSLLATERTHDALFLQAFSLHRLADSENGRVHDYATEAERTATELLEVLRPDHPTAIKTLILRAGVREFLGKTAEAAADSALALTRAADDPDALRIRAISLERAGNTREALDVLRHVVVRDHPRELAMRARLAAQAGLEADARADLDRSFELAGDVEDESLWFALADAAIALRDSKLAQRAIDQLPSRITDNEYRAITVARIALLKDRNSDALNDLRKLAEKSSSRRTDLLLELATRFLRNERHGDAVSCFELAGVQTLQDDMLRKYVSALFGNRDLIKANEVVQKVLTRTPPPVWGLYSAANLALEQQDPNEAIRRLTEIVARTDSAPSSLRINLAAAFIDIGRNIEASEQLDAVLEGELESDELVRTMVSLNALGRVHDAIEIGLRGIRKFPNKPDLQRIFATIVVAGASNFPTPNAVAVGVSVRTEGAGGSKWTTIVKDNADPLRGELSAEDSEALGLAGKHIGDEVIRWRGAWNEERRKIAELVPAAMYASHDIMTNFSDRFPQEPFFATSFAIGKPDDVRALTPILASLETRKQRAAAVLEAYAKNTLPLGFVAQSLGLTIAEAMASISSHGTIRLLADWSNQAGRNESNAAAASASQVVLTRAALETAYLLGILEPIASTYHWIVPRSLLRELRSELREATHEAARGQTVVAASGAGLTHGEIPPSHPLLAERTKRLNAQLEWIEKHADACPRPLDTLEDDRKDREQLLSLVGLSGADAIALAVSTASSIYSDDLGMRRLLPASVRSFSTLSVVERLRMLGTFSRQQSEELTLRLLEHRYAFVRPSPSLLQTGIRVYGFDWSNLRTAFACLGTVENALEAATTVAELIRQLEASMLQTISTKQVIRLSLEGMRLAWPPVLCAQLVAGAVEQICRLLPHAIRDTRQACTEFLASELVLKK